MMTGTHHFVNFTKACDYYRDYADTATPAELEQYVRAKLDDGEIALGKPDIPVGSRLIIIDNGTRYGLTEG